MQGNKFVLNFVFFVSTFCFFFVRPVPFYAASSIADILYSEFTGWVSDIMAIYA